MHASTIAKRGKVYNKLEKTCKAFKRRCVFDSAFCKVQYLFLIKSVQDHLKTENTAAYVVHLQQAKSARKASKWGIRALQGSFPRLKDYLPYKEREERKLILISKIYLLTLRARLAGINQIFSPYMPHLRAEANNILMRCKD